MRKRWILIALAVGLLSAVITGGVALAWGGPGHGWSWGWGDRDERKSAVAEKVAEILGTDATETADAIEQANQEVREETQQAALDDFAGKVAETLGTEADETADAIAKVSEEMFNEALEAKLQDAIDDGRITEEQAQEYRDKAESRSWYGFGYGFKGNDSEGFANRVGEELDEDGDDVAEAIKQALEDIRSEALEERLQEAIDSGKITEEQAEEIRERMESSSGHGFGKRGHRNKFGGKGLWGHGHHRGRGHGDSPTATPEPADDGDSA